MGDELLINLIHTVFCLGGIALSTSISINSGSPGRVVLQQIDVQQKHGMVDNTTGSGEGVCENRGISLPSSRTTLGWVKSLRVPVIAN